MKKILSLMLAIMMLVSAIPTAFAADVDYQNGTEVEYTGSRTTVNADGTETHNAEYTITVPAKLAPAGSGTVTLEGMWPSDATVKVTADPSVEMVNNINSADKKELAVTFPSIEKAGDNTQAVSASAPVSVADISAALFGTWNGKFNYNVDYVAGSGNTGGSTGGDSGTTEPSDPDTGDDEIVASEGYATFSDGVTLSWDELKLAENGTKYSYSASSVSDTKILAGTFGPSCPVASITIPESVTTITGQAFASVTSLTSVTIPASVTSIGDKAFYGCTNLTSINIPNSVTSIADGLFYECTSLTSIALHENITTIGEMAFYRTSLTSIDIPDSATSIDDSAFRDISTLSSISIPEGVTSLGKYLLMDCTNLTNIEIPSTVTNIDTSAVRDCTNLTEIKFAGTTAQWNAITFGESWKLNVPATEVICSDGTVALS